MDRSFTMTPAPPQPRSSGTVLAQIADFEATIKDIPPPVSGDFAAELQWEAWETHRAELKQELEQARLVERANTGTE